MPSHSATRSTPGRPSIPGRRSSPAVHARSHIDSPPAPGRTVTGQSRCDTVTHPGPIRIAATSSLGPLRTHIRPPDRQLRAVTAAPAVPVHRQATGPGQTSTSDGYRCALLCWTVDDAQLPVVVLGTGVDGIPVIVNSATATSAPTIMTTTVAMTRSASYAHP